MKLDKKKMEAGARLILQGMGVDLNDSNFRDTPSRVAKMYAELLTPPKNNMTTFPAPAKGIICLRGHTVFAICPHHLLPVELRAYVAYIPNKKVLGLSKLARIVESQLTTPIMQEELAIKAVDALQNAVDPQAAGVVLSGTHGCMRVRGIESTGDVACSELRGLFLHSEAARREFFSLIGKP